MSVDGSPPRYSASSIQVFTFGEAVRRRPEMYFGLGRADPRLVVAVVQGAARAPFQWELRAGASSVAVQLLVEADLRFTLSFNAILPGLNSGVPWADGRSLIPEMLPLAAAVAVSTLTTVTLSTAGRRWEQDLVEAEPVSAPRDCGACDETGTRVTFTLDPGFFAAGTEIPRNLAELTADLGLGGEVVDLSACDLVITDLRPTS